MNYKDIQEILECDEHIEEHNIEQLAAKLLFDLTRNTGFEVSKGRVGGVIVITIFKDRKDIPQDKEYIELNDVFFNQNTASKLDEKANWIIEEIDDSKLIGRYKIRSRFNGITLDIDQLSAGCKTVLNVLYYTDKVFCLKECGNNALDVLYGFENGFVYSDYALIPFNMEKVTVQTETGSREISDYEELKEWWSNEE